MERGWLLPIAVASPVRRDAYDVVVVVHAVVAVMAFGAIALSGVYAMTARRPGGPGALEEVRRYFSRPPRAEAAVLAVAVLGVGAVLLDPTGPELGELWMTAALLLWVVASVLWLAAVRPAELALGRALGRGQGLEPGEAPHAEVGLTTEEGRAADRHGRRLVRASAVSSVIFVLALGLMVFQPR